MAIMPGASRAQKFTGNKHKAPVTKIVLHTTEGGSWPGYGGGGSAPHFTVHRDGTIRQHIDTAQSAKALVNKAGGVETNNAGCIQIEFIGSCDRAYAKKHGLFFVPDATDEDLAGLASVLRWIHDTHGVPLTATGLTWSDSNAAYLSAPQRLSSTKWLAYKGVLGHQHVPENTHWDPGKLPVGRLLAIAGGIGTGGGKGAATKTATSKPATSGKLKVDGRWGTSTTTRLQRFLNALGAKLTVDGRMGPSSWAALQRWLGHPVVDGLIEHQSYKPAELGNGISENGWEYEGRKSEGSKTIRRLQKKVGVTVDGIVYEGTTAALQRYLNAQ